MTSKRKAYKLVKDEQAGWAGVHLYHVVLRGVAGSLPHGSVGCVSFEMDKWSAAYRFLPAGATHYCDAGFGGFTSADKAAAWVADTVSRIAHDARQPKWEE